MNKKVTPWFAARVKPVRRGFYEVKEKHGRSFVIFFSWWDGKRFCFRQSFEASKEFDAYLCESGYGDSAIWRGLARKP